MYSLQLSSEQLAIRDSVRDFVAKRIRPVALNAQRLDAAERPLLIDAIDDASRLGLRALALAESSGGAGADNLTCCIVTEELAVGDADVAATLAETSRLAPVFFDRLMTPAQRERFLPQFLSNHRYHLAHADHEPHQDAALGVNYHRPVATRVSIATTAARAGNGDWIVNGRKTGVANAPVALLFAVQVATPDSQDVSTLLVARDTPGVAVHARDSGTVGHGPHGDVTFEDCRVPAANLLGGRLIDGMDAAGHGCPLFQALNLGIGRAAYEAALDYAKLRTQGGRRIVAHQAIGAKLADIAVRLAVARAIVWQAAWASDHPEARADRSIVDLPLQLIAKAYASEAMYRVAKDAAEVFGAMGVMRDMPLQKYVHDALVCLHAGEGNSDAKLRIAEALAGFRRPATA